jgi:hypothetical protein
MVNLRALTSEDLVVVKQIHERYYADEFAEPDFLKNYHGVYTITDENNIPVIIGGVKPIAEVIILTDKSFSPWIKREALYQMLDVASFTAGAHQHNQIHCAIQDAAYERHLKKVGFRPVKGNFLVMDV